MVGGYDDLKKVMKESFEKSKKVYDKFIKIYGRKPYRDEWNKIAKEQNLLSNVSMRYIGDVAFKKKR